MSIPRYPKYRASGVEWLGEVPDHWQRKRFKQVFRERDDRSARGEELLLSVSAYTGVSPRSELVEDGESLTRADSLEGYKICRRGDLVINIMLAWNRGLGITSYDGIVSPAYAVFRVLDSSEPRYLDYLVRSDEAIRYFKAYSAGVIDSRLRLYPDVFGSLCCVLPPASEQKQLAAFLDRETAQIDALIAQQRRLIELLKEKREAVISHAVTKGLNPDAPMKPSGVDWLGDVPAHWDIRPLRWSVRCSSGEGIPTEAVREEPQADFSIPVIGGNGIMGFTVTGTITDAVLAIGRVGALCGNVHVVLPPAWITDNALVLRPDQNAFALEYLSWVLQARRLNDLASKTAQPLITGTQVSDQRVPCPPLSEQRRIAGAVLNALSELDSLMSASRQAITLMQERRTALISAAVTGKIDVRCHAETEQGAEAA